MIASFHGFEVDLNALRRRFSISSHGANLKSVIDVAERLHLASNAVEVKLDAIQQLHLPAILHWNFNHFVVLKSVERGRVGIHDPAVGERRLSVEEFGQHFTGVALELTPTATFRRGNDTRTLKLRHFWPRIAGLKRALLQVLALSLFLQAFAVLAPLYMQAVVDKVLLRRDGDLLIVLAIGFMLLMLVQTGTSVLRQFVLVYTSSRMNVQMAANLFRHLIRLPMDYFVKRHMGDIVSRFSSLESVRGLFTTGMIAAGVDGLISAITLTVMFYYDVRLTLIVIGVVVLYALLRFAFYRPFLLANVESIVAKAKQDSHFMESARAIQTIKLFQRETDRENHWQELLENTVNKGIRITRWQIGYDTINSLLFGAENVIVTYFAATAVMHDQMTVGMLFAFMSYKGRFVGSINTLVTQLFQFKMIELHLNRLADIAFATTEADVRRGAPTLAASSPIPATETIRGAIEVRDLTYRYGDNDVPAFADLSFSIEPGETVAITGPSGCGKTTLIKCLMGLFVPTRGEILVDGRQLAHVPGYRNQIAGIMQDDMLMTGSIGENIACFEATIDMDKVRRCAQAACVHEEIMRMPMEYDTLVGDMGSGLSGGQQQRVIIARALYREPRILFMDEATSFLDMASDRAISEHIQSLKITRVIVAHRPETIRFAHRRIDLAAAKSGGGSVFTGAAVCRSEQTGQ